VAKNGKQRPARPRIELKHGPASPEQAAAIAAAVEQFLHDTAPAPQAAGPGQSPWQRDGVFAGARMGGRGVTPWGDPEPWGR